MPSNRMLVIALLTVAAVATACGGGGTDTPATTTAATTTAPTTTAPETTSPTEAPTTSAEPTTPAPTGPVTFTSGEAQVETTGDLSVTFTAPVNEESTFDPDEGEHALLFLAPDGNALRVAVQVDEEGDDDTPFIAVGLPGTSLFDKKYFPDQFNTQCDVEISVATATQIEGSFECDDLERSDGKQTIDVTGTFSATA